MPRKKALPALPKSIDSLMGPVEVRLVENLDNGKCLGRFLSSERVIEIEQTCNKTQQWHTFFHEQLHLILWDTGGQLSKKAEEHVADAYATWRTRELLKAFGIP